MSYCVYLVCVVVSVTSSLAAAAPSSWTSSSRLSPGIQYAPVANESFSIFNAIKKNFRKNNEDFVAKQQLQEPISKVDEVTPFIGTAPEMHTTNFRSKIHQQNQKVPVLNENDTQSKLNIVKLRNKKQGQLHDNKWKHLVHKSKDLLQYVSSSRIAPNTSRQPGQLELKNMRTLRNTRTPRTRPVKRAGSSLHALFSKRTQGPNRDPPNADQLDMAPARGAFINDMRGKGQICHRHILWPEGPKYDSQGNIIMPMYRPKLYDGKEFFQTQKPRLVLPRCCNCCKKSVLGCQ